MTAVVSTFAPAELEAAVLHVLREDGRPLTARSVADVIARRYVPSSPVAEVQTHVADTLADLAYSGRVIQLPGQVSRWKAAYVDDDTEQFILELRRYFGGRPVEMTADGDLTVKAPPSMFRPLVQP